MSCRTEPPTALVSACLLGVRCRYDGESKANPGLMERLAGWRIVPVCPEQLGGLPTPRPAASLRGGDGLDVMAGRARVLTKTGADVTQAFKRGGEEIVSLARLCGVQVCLLKSRSPSCGLRPNIGVAAAALLLAGYTLEEVD